MNNDNVHFIIYSIKFSDIRHERLGHVNVDSLKRMINLNLSPKVAIDRKHKYKISVQAKQPRKSFHVVDQIYLI